MAAANGGSQNLGRGLHSRRRRRPRRGETAPNGTMPSPYHFFWLVLCSLLSPIYQHTESVRLIYACRRILGKHLIYTTIWQLVGRLRELAVIRTLECRERGVDPIKIAANAEISGRPCKLRMQVNAP